MSELASDVLEKVEMSPNLQASIQRAITYALEQSHRTVTLEHLLLALIEDREAAPILQASRLDTAHLTADVSGYLSNLPDRTQPGDRTPPQLGGDVHHIVQSAGAAARKSRKQGISSALILAAIVGDGRSPAATMLRNRGLTFENAIHALKNAPAPPPGPQPRAPGNGANGAPLGPGPAPGSGTAGAAGSQVRLGPAVVSRAPAQPASAPVIDGPVSKTSPQGAKQILADVRKRIEATRQTVEETQPAPRAGRAVTENAEPQPPPAAQKSAQQSSPPSTASEQPVPGPASVSKPLPAPAPSPEPVTASEAPRPASPAPAQTTSASAPPAPQRAAPQRSTGPVIRVQAPNKPAAPPPASPPVETGSRETVAPPASPPPSPKPPAASEPSVAQPPAPAPQRAEAPSQNDENGPGLQVRANAVAPPPQQALSGAPPNEPPAPPVVAETTAQNVPQPAEPASVAPPVAEPIRTPPSPVAPDAAAEADRVLEGVDLAAEPPASLAQKIASVSRSLPRGATPLQAGPPPPPASSAPPAPSTGGPPPPMPAPNGASPFVPRTEAGFPPQSISSPLPPPPAFAPISGQAPPQPRAEAPPINPETLLKGIPTRMRSGKPVTIEIRAPRAGLDAWAGAGAHPDLVITKAMAMRLRAPEGGLTVEPASPETQWSEGYGGPLRDDTVSWRWTVTPTHRGRIPLVLSASTRVVGRDGLAAERPLPDQTVEVRVSPNYGRLGVRLAGWFVAIGIGAGIGYFSGTILTVAKMVAAQAGL